MDIVLIMGAVLLVGILIAANTSSAKEKIEKEEEQTRKLNEAFYNNIIAKEANEICSTALVKVIEMYENGESMEIADLYYKLGMPEEIAYSKDPKKMKAYFNFSTEEASFLFLTFSMAITERNSLDKYKLWEEEDVFNTHKIILKADEVLFSKSFSNIYLMEEKTVRRNVSYGGVRVSMGPVRMGNFSYSVDDTKTMVFQDYGKVFLTNKRIIFTGKENQINTDITLNSIVDYYLYKDGILICRNNRKNVLLKSSTYKNYLETGEDFIYFTNDFSLSLVKMIQRVANKTYNVDL